MNRIEQILANSMYDSSQFITEQINALNEMADSGINTDQIGIIAHPKVSELSYSILADYLKDHTISQAEYSKYISIDIDRINDIIINIYLGKMHGLKNEQIELYANKQCKYIKQSRIIVENCKDLSDNELHTLLTNPCGLESSQGKALLQEFINGNIKIDRILAIYSYLSINNDIFYDILNGDDYLIQLYTESNDYRDQSLNEKYCTIHLIHKFISGEHYTKLNYLDYAIKSNNEYFNALINGKLKFDSIYTLDKCLCCLYKWHTKCNITITKEMIDCEEHIYYEYYIDTDNRIESHCSNYNNGTALYIIFLSEMNKKAGIRWYQELSWEDFCLIMEKDNGKSYLQAIIDGKDSKIIAKYLSYPDNFVDLISLYTTKKDKEVEIPYLEEHLKDANEDIISDIILLKKNKESNDTIHYCIENYNNEFNPTIYYEDDYTKQYTFIEFLDLSKIFNTILQFRIYSALKSEGATKDELQYYIDHKNKFKDKSYYSTLQLSMLKIYIEVGLDLCECKRVNLTSAEWERINNNYNYAKINFKNKPKCIGNYVSTEDKICNINKELLSNITNFTDDEFYDVLNRSCVYNRVDWINFCLKMSNICTDYDVLYALYGQANNYNKKEKLKTFIEDDEKVTNDVFIKFCKDFKIDNETIKGINLLIPSEEFVQNIVVDSFNNSKNFKAIKYDEDNIFIDIINNKELLGTHVIKFSKDDSDYMYIFEIRHADDTLKYEAKIATNKDVKQAIQKSIELIDGIDEYQEYVSELQEMLNNF